MKYYSPLQRYPGSKRKHTAKIWDSRKYQAIIEPFAGAMHYSINRTRGEKAPDHLYFAESDPSVRAIYIAWQQPELWTQVNNWISYWKALFDCDESVYDRVYGNLLAEYQELLPLMPEQMEDEALAVFAAISLVLRKLTFGGQVRDNRDSLVNIKYCKGQVDELLKWQYAFPERPTVKMHMDSSWEHSIYRFKNDKFITSAEALIDAPYYSSKEIKCTGCFLGHRPHDLETLQLTLDCFEAVLDDRRIQRVVVTNYMSPEMDDGLRHLAAAAGIDLNRSEVGKLNTMNKVGKKKKGNTEVVWSLTRSTPKVTAVAA